MKAGCARLIPLISLLLFAAPSFGQAWSGILAPARATDWTKAGIPGGIPNRTTICTTVNSGMTTAAIQTAITNCAVNQVVFFSAGTYNIGGLHSNKGVVLRGAGPNSTKLVLSGSNIFLGSTGASGLGGQPGGGVARAWTGGLTRGSTQLTISSTTGLSAGMTVSLDEHNPAWVFSSGNAGSQGSGRGDNESIYGTGERRVMQLTKIVSVDSGTQITVRDPVGYTHTAGLAPEVFWWTSPPNIQYAGVEDMHIDSNQTAYAIGMIHCDYCWVKNVWMDDVGRAGVHQRYAYGGIVRDSYFNSALGGAPTQYGSECVMSSNVLYENNIYWNVTSSFQRSTCYGAVDAYNYVNNAVSGNLYPDYATHAVHNLFHLLEGNDIGKIQFDNVWGSASHSTVFRNRANGAGSNKMNYRTPFVVGAHNWYMNFVANVAGTAGFHINYQCDNAHAYSSDQYVYDLGFWNGCAAGTSNYDAAVLSKTMKWGNWDADTNGVLYSASEKADGDASFPGLANPSQSFPASFYLPAKPGWFGNVPWPAAGPDVTCTGNCVPNAGNKANKIPARVCYESLSKNASGYLTAFDGQGCYANDTVVPPEPPSNVAVQ